MLKMIFSVHEGQGKSIAENLMHALASVLFFEMLHDFTEKFIVTHTYLWRRLLYTALQRRCLVCHTLKETLNTHLRALSS